MGLMKSRLVHRARAWCVVHQDPTNALIDQKSHGDGAGAICEICDTRRAVTFWFGQTPRGKQSRDFLHFVALAVALLTNRNRRLPQRVDS